MSAQLRAKLRNSGVNPKNILGPLAKKLVMTSRGNSARLVMTNLGHKKDTLVAVVVVNIICGYQHFISLCDFDMR